MVSAPWTWYCKKAIGKDWMKNRFSENIPVTEADVKLNNFNSLGKRKTNFIKNKDLVQKMIEFGITFSLDMLPLKIQVIWFICFDDKSW